MGRLWRFGVLGILFAFGACHWLPDRESIRVLQDIAAGDGPSSLKVETPAPRRTEIRYQVAGRPYRADVYAPAVTPMAGIVLVPGVAEAGKDDPRLVAFATTLARARFRVLVPDIPGVRALKIQAQDAVAVVDAFLFLVSDDERLTGQRAGIGAFSYAVGPAVLAAMDLRIRDRVDFVLGVGGYYDLAQVLTFLTTGYFKEADGWRRLQPVEFGKWLFVASNLDRIEDPADRRTLQQIVERRLWEPGVPVDRLTARLGEEGSSVYALVNNRNPDRVPALIASLPEGIRRELAALNLAGRDMSTLTARLILVHGKEDAIIPYTESVALARAAPTGQASLHLVAGLSHVDVEPEKLDRRRLVKAVEALLAERRPRGDP
ncbi:MAG: alpha/beta hydrolase [Gammaproteobacteria bacterium]|nr:alpha/beta hydrolase [Gammaproteobacteria bacterium]MDJ0891424.1 alpha/beta hydrolase [Gammaproteobacteria bacterium]